MHENASMGPLVYTSGSPTRFPPSALGLYVASMGPLVYTSGSFTKQVVKAEAKPASMGPLVYTSGSSELSGVPPLVEMLQWGRWFTPAEASPIVAGKG